MRVCGSVLRDILVTSTQDAATHCHFARRVNATFKDAHHLTTGMVLQTSKTYTSSARSYSGAGSADGSPTLSCTLRGCPDISGPLPLERQ